MGGQGLHLSFPTSASFYGSGYGNGEPLKGFAVLNAAQQAAARAALDQFSSVAKVSFTEIAESATTHADLRLASSDRHLGALRPHGVYSVAVLLFWAFADVGCFDAIILQVIARAVSVK